MTAPINLRGLRAAWALSALFLTACQHPSASDKQALHHVNRTPSHQVTRSDCMKIAEGYATHRWKAAHTNVLHGKDKYGTRVDTPDVGYNPAGGFAGWWKPGDWNEGMPYKWGGFDTLESFDRGVKDGRPAGDAFTAAKREQNDSAISSDAVGVDCSGLIARCWRMASTFSTYEIARHCERLPDLDSLRPGDVVNKEHEHVSLFIRFEDPAHEIMLVYDSGCPPNLRVAKHGVYTSYLRDKGYQAWRYRGMID